MFKRIYILSQLLAINTRLIVDATATLLLVVTACAPHTIAQGAASSYQSYDTSIDYTIFRLASEKNDPSAQYLVGRNYLKGKSVKKDVKKAIQWLERAANQNHAKAQYQLGKMYLYGEEVNQDLNQAFYYLIQAAGSHDLDAQFELANYYLQGNPGTEQYNNAIKWLRRAVKREHVRAHYLLGKLIYEGKGTAPNPTEAVALLSIAEENGLQEASRYLKKVKADNPDLANLLVDNKVAKSPSPSASSPPPVKPAPQVATSTASPPQAKSEPNANEYYRMGLAALTKENNARNTEKAAEYFQKAAEKNHGKAQYQLAKLYQQGIGVEQDARLYRQWLEKSANSGVQSAKRDLRALNDKTQSSPTSPPRSAPMMVLVDREKTSPNDLYILGLKHLTGNTVEKDTVKASKLFLKAAKLNHPHSQYQLGLMYIDGIGLKSDTDKAKLWLAKAAGAGVADAQDVLNKLFPKQSAEQETTMVSIATDAIEEQPEKSITEKPPAPQSPALSKLEKQANNNDPAAQYTLGLNYLHGRNKYELDIGQAVHWLTKAANNNFTDAQIELGNLYFQGTNIERDYEQAAHWLDLAAQSGNPEAQYMLGRLFQKGLGVARDKSVAIMWYRRAANQGHREARKRLGGCRIC
ncbi:tetratricopeptide repeat protein [Kaarinaea lacus]